jgi:hypothetical protein
LELEGLPLAHVTGMLQTLARVALLLGIFPVFADQTNVSVAQDASPRPLRDITEPPSAAQVDLLDFEFQEPSFRSMAPIDSDPVIGAEYVVEAHIDGEHAVATMNSRSSMKRAPQPRRLPCSGRRGLAFLDISE